MDVYAYLEGLPGCLEHYDLGLARKLDEAVQFYYIICNIFMGVDAYLEGLPGCLEHYDLARLSDEAVQLFLYHSPPHPPFVPEY